ncbi:MAG: hypothetical protein FNT15_09605, partial [Sulfurovum sp.]
MKSKFLSTLLMMQMLQAGDPCPIHVDMYESQLSWNQKSKDSLFLKIYKNSHYECSESSIKYLTAKQSKIVEEAITDKDRAFRCTDAHKNKKLQKEFSSYSGSMIMARGEKRVIFVMPHWQTTCINS